MSFIWTCEYMKLPLTLNLFKSLFKLDENKNTSFITFSSINGAMLVYPGLDDLKEYKDKIIWVRVPKTLGHPFRYMPPVFWSKFNARETLGLDGFLHLSRRERHAFFYFVKSKDKNLPSGWIPHVAIFQQNIHLSLVGISFCLTPGMISTFSFNHFLKNFLLTYIFLLYSIFQSKQAIWFIGSFWVSPLMENTTDIFHSLPGQTTQPTNIFIRCALTRRLSPSKITSSVGFLRFTITLWVQKGLPDGGGVTPAQRILLIILEQDKVFFLLPRKKTGILRPGLILI